MTVVSSHREGFRTKAQRHQLLFEGMGRRRFSVWFHAPNRSDWLHDLKIEYDCLHVRYRSFRASTRRCWHHLPILGSYAFPRQSRRASTINWQIFPPSSTLNRQPGTKRLHRASLHASPGLDPFLTAARKDDRHLEEKLAGSLHGGMALVNIHPDYIEFGGGAVTAERYPGSAHLSTCFARFKAMAIRSGMRCLAKSLRGLCLAVSRSVALLWFIN